MLLAKTILFDRSQVTNLKNEINTKTSWWRFLSGCEMLLELLLFLVLAEHNIKGGVSPLRGNQKPIRGFADFRPWPTGMNKALLYWTRGHFLKSYKHFSISLLEGMSCAELYKQTVDRVSRHQTIQYRLWSNNIVIKQPKSRQILKKRTI